MRLLLLTLLLVVGAGAYAAGVEVREFASPEQEARYKHLIAELRCTVCQNQNIAESNAELATDLRRKTYELIKQGQSDQQILDYMVERYGNFVLYRPPLTAGTLLLWVGPFLVAAFGGFLLLRVLQKRRSARTGTEDGSAVTEDKLHQAEALLRDEGDQR
jgi:cytochrome c-type biogenesis protein CcmH